MMCVNSSELPGVHTRHWREAKSAPLDAL